MNSGTRRYQCIVKLFSGWLHKNYNVDIIH